MTVQEHPANPPNDPFSVANFRAQRAEVETAQWGVAAPSTSERFKLRPDAYKPCALRWDHRLNPESAKRAGSSLKGAFKYLKNPDMISLGGGLPLSDYFPFKSMDMTLPPSETSDLKTRSEKDITLHSGKRDLLDGISTYDLDTALNYCQGSGSAQLLRWITEHTEIVHNPPYADWQCTMSIGNTSALDMALRMFTQPGDFIISDEYTFATAVETAMPMHVQCAGVRMDEQGMIPDSLRDLLEHWDPAKSNGARKPYVVYAIPTGQNPTGATQSLQRRKEIYKIAQEQDLIILEDDPYYFLQLDSIDATPEDPSTSTSHNASKYLLAKLVPSYLRLDTDGRVVRMDSFSKVISPGARLGWITASQQIVDKYKNHADVSTQGPSGLSQLALFKLLDEQWGHSGYFHWLTHIRREYTARRNFMINVCQQYLPSDIVDWETPQAGMFQWLKVDWTKHPHFKTKPMLEIEEEIWLSSIRHGSLIARGSWFYAEADKSHGDMFFRMTFAAAPLNKIEEAILRLGKALRESFDLQ
ncbi:unnamed protein product [Penicillium salamii]|uniref:aromatic-amino-acid transaminase n=1 Tax=Penicillium salamii TaxID=1612424 RepID=A0A9W4NGR9_9EURO|nr:unnamed protein product [Penicillium salamii]